MTLPFLSISVAMLYFGWLWHDRKATDRAETNSISLGSKPLKRTKRCNLRRLRVSRRRTFNLENVPGRSA